jgi:hypothetical protein
MSWAMGPGVGRQALVLAGVGLLLAGCVSSPKQTVLDLDTTDARWTSRKCVAARKAVARYDDRQLPRKVVSVLGNLAAPFAGTGASLALNAAQDSKRKELNHRVRSACVSDPLGARSVRAARR